MHNKIVSSKNIKCFKNQLCAADLSCYVKWRAIEYHCTKISYMFYSIPYIVLYIVVNIMIVYKTGINCILYHAYLGLLYFA